MKTKDLDCEPDNDGNLKEKIITFWDTNGIFSFESSSYNGELHIDSFNNYLESQFIAEMISEKGENSISSIDVGAGLGRLTHVLANRSECVHTLEPAKRIFSMLKENCIGLSNVTVFNTDFESYESGKKYDVAVVSGLLYFYPHKMVLQFLNKLAKYLKTGGVVIVRDFIVSKGRKKLPSSAIDGFCYFRDCQYWNTVAQETGLVVNQTFQSSFSYPFRKLFHLGGKVGLTKILGQTHIRGLMLNYLKWKKKKNILLFRPFEKKTVFIVIEKKQENKV